MKFEQWFITENSLKDLYTSTVKAFPKATRRQYAIDPIKISKLHWVPYLGLKTLYLKGLAQNTENGKEYMPSILFKNVKYGTGFNVKIVANNGKSYEFNRIDPNSDVLVRCNCKDFYWRGNYADHLDKSLFGRKRSPYIPTGNRPSVNPNNDPMLCKHIIKLYRVLPKSMIR